MKIPVRYNTLWYGSAFFAPIQVIFGVGGCELLEEKASHGSSAGSHWHIEMIEWLFAALYCFQNGFSYRASHFSSKRGPTDLLEGILAAGIAYGSAIA